MSYVWIAAALTAARLQEGRTAYSIKRNAISVVHELAVDGAKCEFKSYSNALDPGIKDKLRCLLQPSILALTHAVTVSRSAGSTIPYCSRTKGSKLTYLEYSRVQGRN